MGALDRQRVIARWLHERTMPRHAALVDARPPALFRNAGRVLEQHLRATAGEAFAETFTRLLEQEAPTQEPPT